MGVWRSNVVFSLDRGEFVPVVEAYTVPLKRQAHWVVPCKWCSSDRTIRHGRTSAYRIRYYCNDCARTFVDNNAPRGMRFPTPVIASALNQFYEAASLHKIQRQLRLDFGEAPDVSNIYRWVAKYTDKAVQLLRRVPVKVGPVWIADETVVKLKSGTRRGRRGLRLKEPSYDVPGERAWLWDAIDEDTRFLLATHLTPARTVRDAQALMTKAARRTGTAPHTIITDKLAAYGEAIDRVFGALTLHRTSGPFEIRNSTRAIERLHGTFKDRTKVMRSLATRESARLVISGWAVHYNWFRPHSGIGNRTPARAAGAKTRIRSWADVVGAGQQV